MSLIPNDAVAIGLGAFLGAMSRYQAGRLAAEWIATDPNKLARYQGWHTAGINVAGSFILGGVTGSPVVQSPSPSKIGLTPRAKLMLGVGFCGSFTTFSTFSVDVVSWLQQGKFGKAGAYIMTNNVGGFVAAAAGLMLVKKVFGV